MYYRCLSVCRWDVATRKLLPEQELDIQVPSDELHCRRESLPALLNLKREKNIITVATGSQRKLNFSKKLARMAGDQVKHICFKDAHVLVFIYSQKFNALFILKYT